MNGSLFDNQTRWFWTLHIGGWLAWAFGAKYAFTVLILEEVPPHYLEYVLVISGIGLLITLGMRYLFKWVWGRSIALQILVFIGGTVAGGYAWLEARSYLYMNFIETKSDMADWYETMGEAAKIYEQVSYLSTFTVAWFVILAWAALYFGIKYYGMFQRVQKSALKSAAMAHEAQLKMLRYQLNPHFLFNTLNAISTLVLEQATEDANRMVTRLSAFLRHSLDNDPMKLVTLEQELAALKLYLDIEKVRFEDRLALELDIEDEARRALIPSLLLQPLVENAIKYGIAQSEAGGRIRIAARVFAGDLLLELSDDGPGVELEDGWIPGSTGVGLRNTRERLTELYGSRQSFRLGRTEPHGLTAHIRIPFESKSSPA